MVELYVTVDNIDDIIAQNYTVIRVYTAAASTSANFSTLDGTLTLVANQSGYSYVDTDGDSSTWYKVAYYGASPGESSQSPSAGWQGTVVQYYCTDYDVRQGLAAGDTTDDAIGEEDGDLIWDIIAAVSRFIDEYKGVESGAYLASGSETRYYTGTGRRRQRIDMATTVSAVAVEETDGTYTSWTADTDYYLWPYNYSALGEPVRVMEVVRKSGSSKSVWNIGPKRVQVTGVFGVSTTVPADIQQACAALVTRVYKSYQTGWQDAGASLELGQLIYAQAQHPSVKMILDQAFPRTRSGI